MWLHAIDFGYLLWSNQTIWSLSQLPDAEVLFLWFLSVGHLLISEQCSWWQQSRDIKPKFHRPGSAVPKGRYHVSSGHPSDYYRVLTTSCLLLWWLLFGQKHGQDPGSWAQGSHCGPILSGAWRCRLCEDSTEAWPGGRKKELYLSKWQVPALCLTPCDSYWIHLYW